MLQTHEKAPNLFKAWLTRMSDEYGRDLSADDAAKLLGKAACTVRCYIRGDYPPPKDALLLMDAYSRGYRPRYFEGDQ